MEEKRITNICTFYVSKWHLAPVLLYFINNKIDKDTKIITLLEDNIEEIETMKMKLGLKKEVLDVEWKKINQTNYRTISKILKENMVKKQIVIIDGNINFIKNVKENVDQYFNENKEKLDELNAKIKIISCYDTLKLDGKIQEILDGNDKVLNTSGEKEKYEIFSDYEISENINKNDFRRNKEKQVERVNENNKKEKEGQVKKDNNNDVFEEIRKYKQLYDEGAITEEEFRLKKKKLMDI